MSPPDDGRYEERQRDYINVASRIAEFRAKYPDGSLQPEGLNEPFRVVEIRDNTFIVVVAAAYRHPEDVRPGIGMAWEPFPGRTPYTRNSELMNAETSAWGRAIVAVLAADAKRGIATQEDVRNRQAEQAPQPPPSAEDVEAARGFLERASLVTERPELQAIYKEAGERKVLGVPVAYKDIEEQLGTVLIRLGTALPPASEGAT